MAEVWRRRAVGFAGVVALVVLTGCAGAVPEGDAIYDPHETQNREIHAFNKQVDSALFRGAGDKPQGPVVRAIANVGHNLGLPGKVLNSVLQGRPEPAVKNTFRFLINSTLGLGGVFDPAQSLSLPQTDTDFGETLHVWGAGEGAYVELPLLGPSTERDALGRAVDLLLDPVGFAFSGRDAAVATAFRLGAEVSDRTKYGTTVDSILYDSADSYAQSRLLYLQSRRYQLATQEDSDALAYDPYDDPYGQ